MARNDRDNAGEGVWTTSEFDENLSGEDKIVLFPNPQRLSLSVRASALIYSDEKSKQLLSLIEKVAPSDATALIKGETGTGKELVARHIHNLSPRKAGPFAAINCGAFSETLVESELFGYERGAFTGAVGSKKGWFETANGGTLFLDEIGDLPLSTQVKLLRVLQEREVTPIGSRKPVPIDVRLIAATNVNLVEAVNAGRFREDLYYRIKVVPIEIPPLRDRKGDILPLVEHFLEVYRNRLHTVKPQLTSDTIKLMNDYPWPGNIRELENVIHRALLVCDGKLLKPSDLNLPSLQSLAGSGVSNSLSLEDQMDALLSEYIKLEPDELLENCVKRIVLKAYEYSHQNQVQTARVLGISRNVLRAYLKQYGIIQ
ncbi:sigma-54-dependent Fis family transcriptional regulator [Methylophilus sp. Leaf414]|uniref:sigma-54 interaction domain-containing protein n=1 Tax=Methylophilus sp. Leaf414 TaxID=1736371 RepID=UPI0009E7EE5E|nr:sigma-54 dependent transcriptional regulator [Methylophilus sp. Leaf414]